MGRHYGGLLVGAVLGKGTMICVIWLREGWSSWTDDREAHIYIFSEADLRLQCLNQLEGLFWETFKRLLRYRCESSPRGVHCSRVTWIIQGPLGRRSHPPFTSLNMTRTFYFHWILRTARDCHCDREQVVSLDAKRPRCLDSDPRWVSNDFWKYFEDTTTGLSCASVWGKLFVRLIEINDSVIRIQVEKLGHHLTWAGQNLYPTTELHSIKATLNEIHIFRWADYANTPKGLVGWGGKCHSIVLAYDLGEHLSIRFDLIQARSHKHRVAAHHHARGKRILKWAYCILVHLPFSASILVCDL